ncbi:MAG: hypothetical protein Fur0021_27040 [Candidatus Promineifilaceae bacterium]
MLTPDTPKSWQIFQEADFALRFRYPAVTPQGRAVERRAYTQPDRQRIHFFSTEAEGVQHEGVYFEITRYQDLLPQTEYAQHKAALTTHRPEVRFTPLTAGILNGITALHYTFILSDKQRAVVLLPLPDATYRLLYNPRSPLNLDILATVTLA